MRITAPHFCAGLVLRDGVVVRAAPIIKYMLGWKSKQVLFYARVRGWEVDA